MYKGRLAGPKVVPTPEQVFDLVWCSRGSDREALERCTGAGWGCLARLGCRIHEPGRFGSLSQRVSHIEWYKVIEGIFQWKIIKHTCNRVICSFRYMRNRQIWYFKDVAGKKQPYVHGTTMKRQELCQRFDYPCYWEVTLTNQSRRWCAREPKKKPAVVKLSEVGGESWLSSTYYLLVGQKTGKTWQERKKQK